MYNIMYISFLVDNTHRCKEHKICFSFGGVDIMDICILVYSMCMVYWYLLDIGSDKKQPVRRTPFYWGPRTWPWQRGFQFAIAVWRPFLDRSGKLFTINFWANWSPSSPLTRWVLKEFTTTWALQHVNWYGLPKSQNPTETKKSTATGAMGTRQRFSTNFHHSWQFNCKSKFYMIHLCVVIYIYVCDINRYIYIYLFIYVCINMW